MLRSATTHMPFHCPGCLQSCASPVHSSNRRPRSRSPPQRSRQYGRQHGTQPRPAAQRGLWAEPLHHSADGGGCPAHVCKACGRPLSRDDLLQLAAQQALTKGPTGVYIQERPSKVDIADQGWAEPCMGKDPAELALPPKAGPTAGAAHKQHQHQTDTPRSSSPAQAQHLHAQLGNHPRRSMGQEAQLQPHQHSHAIGSMPANLQLLLQELQQGLNDIGSMKQALLQSKTQAVTVGQVLLASGQQNTMNPTAEDSANNVAGMHTQPHQPMGASQAGNVMKATLTPQPKQQSTVKNSTRQLTLDPQQQLSNIHQAAEQVQPNNSTSASGSIPMSISHNHQKPKQVPLGQKRQQENRTSSSGAYSHQQQRQRSQQHGTTGVRSRWQLGRAAPGDASTILARQQQLAQAARCAS